MRAHGTLQKVSFGSRQGISPVDMYISRHRRRYRELANELRLLVFKMKHTEAAEELRLLAARYERLAEHAEAVTDSANED